jgi:hypothetical protein
MNTDANELPIKFVLTPNHKAVLVYMAVGAAIGLGVYCNETYWKRGILSQVNHSLYPELS